MDSELFFIEKDNFKRIVGRLIQDNRLQKNLTQDQLGNLTGHDRRYISAIERGEKNASFYEIYKIIKALELDPTSFIEQI